MYISLTPGVNEIYQWGAYISQCVYLVNIPEPVQYQIYALEFPFDLRCESATYARMHLIFTVLSKLQLYRVIIISELAKIVLAS